MFVVVIHGEDMSDSREKSSEEQDKRYPRGKAEQKPQRVERVSKDRVENIFHGLV